jgi:hypothetical protein
MTEPTFGLAIAREADSLVGFGYGYGLRGDTRWWDGFLTLSVPRISSMAVTSRVAHSALGQLSQGQGHPGNVPAGGTSAYPHPGSGKR